MGKGKKASYGAPGRLIKPGLLGPTLRISNLEGLGELRRHIYNKFPGDAGPASLGTTFEKYTHRHVCNGNNLCW